ncbi:FtsH protease activity modulator HflK [Candidatus Profftia tarda]
MVLKHPSNNEQDRDPWGHRRTNTDKSREHSNKSNRGQSPPDLDEIFRNISKKISRMCGKGTSSINTSQTRTPINNTVIICSIAACVLIWAASGLYTIKEAERGVVISFGKFNHLVQPGLNWKLNFIDEVTPVNVESVRELAASGVMLTSDENVVRVEMNVQYRVTQPEAYLFNVTNADDSLRQATDSALRAVIGKYSMDKILTEGRTIIRTDTHTVLEETIKPYNMGITLLDVNFQTARPPEEVKAAFDDAIAARENEQQYIREAEAYSNEVQPRANGQAQRILENARAYKDRTILEAQGEVGRFIRLLPEYRLSPEFMRERMYLETMEHILRSSRKLLIDNKSNQLMVLPIDKLIRKDQINQHSKSNNRDTGLIPLDSTSHRNAKRSSDGYVNNNMIDQRRANAQRNTNRKGENN